MSILRVVCATVLLFVIDAYGADAPTVIVQPAKLQELSSQLSYPGVVETKTKATVLAEADGVIRKIHAQLGQSVKAGGKLVTIQQTDPVYRYAPVNIIAPVSGVVSEMKITEGALVTKGQILVSVTDPKNLKILIEVPASDVSTLKNGDVGTFETPGLFAPLKVKLAGLSPTLDLATGTASAELMTVGEDGKLLRPGMVGKVLFKANARQAFLVPEDALVQRQGQTFLRIVESDIAKKVPVKVGTRERGQAEIVEGLKEGLLVVHRTSAFIADGEKVKIEETKKEEAKEGQVN